MKTCLRIFKDKVLLVKAALSFNITDSSIHIAVLRATSAAAISSAVAPSDKHLLAVFQLGCTSRLTARACVASLMDRLHSTRNSTVALKTLIIIHSIVSRSSFILRDQLSFSPSGGRNFLNLSSFRNGADHESWEISAWVRWYAEFIEQSLITARVLGYFLVSPLSSPKEARIEKISALLNQELIGEIDALTTLIEQMRNHPESIHLQRNNLIYEVVRLVRKDYGVVRAELYLRLLELSDRVAGLSHSELTESICGLQRIEDCKENLLLFGSTNNNDGLWEVVANTKAELTAMKEKKEGWKMVVVRKKEASGLSWMIDSSVPRKCSTFHLAVF